MDRIMTPVVNPASRAADGTFPMDNIDIQTVSREDIVQALSSSPELYDLGQSTVVRLSKTLAMKAGGNVLASEAAILEVVASQTDIRAPRVHRAWQVDDKTKYFGTLGYIVMDYVDGRPLEDCWENLSEEQKLDIANQVAEMVSKLQSVKLPDAGPVGGGPCRGRFFTDYSAGPFDTASEMQDWFNHKLKVAKAFKKAPKDIPEFKFDEFVVVHQDISPRNLILDADDHVWLVDWAHAGAYPRAFENAALSAQSAFPEFNDMVLSLLPRYPDEEKQLKAIEYVLSVAPLA